MSRSWKRDENIWRLMIEWAIHTSRYLLVPFYFGLVVALGFYCWQFGKEILEVFNSLGHLREEDLMLKALTLIDMVMIANLIKMIYAGSYHTFVNRLEHDTSEKASSSMLKVKMGGSLIGISSIHLLHTFINAAKEDTRVIVIKCSIHLIFVVSTVALAFIDYLHCKSTPSEATH